MLERPSPHGEGGLKSASGAGHGAAVWSLPAWGGWIEMLGLLLNCLVVEVPPRMGRVD